MKRAQKQVLVALLVVGSVVCALLVARAEPTPDLTKGVDGIAAWLHELTGECADVRKGEDFTAFVGPVRADVYLPSVVEWGTCRKQPYEQLGLIVLRPGIEEAWRNALARGEVRGDPDLAFGDGFALTGSIGMEHLGLKRLECTPGSCSFVQIEHH
ncbi:hypothetical protein ABZ345_01400 [Lentzea sp. NPDC005914]|uniref:hypothetical protein n=1 Tax=Lentzea sp. NPDC005914 TaxID=3154572 RepID=UPI0033D0BA17